MLSLLLAACPDPTDLGSTGEVLYGRHCASCHGTNGRGDGPLAAALHRAPSDLTTLAMRAGGTFEESRVMATVDGRREVAEHGPREMPVWGVIFAQERVGKPFGIYEAIVDTRALADYLRSIQQEGTRDESDPRS